MFVGEHNVEFCAAGLKRATEPPTLIVPQVVAASDAVAPTE